MMNKLHRVTIYFLSFVSVLTLYAQEKAPGKRVDVGGYSLHFNVQGSGDQTIVIETGTGSWSLQWMQFQKDLAEHFTVITYDRAGYGWSDPSPYARTASNIVEELHTGLQKLNVSKNYILLGHSYGGMIVKAFAKKYPGEVKAIIFADAASEYQFSKLPLMVNMVMEGGKTQFRQTGLMARGGMLSPEVMPVDSTLIQDYWDDYQVSLTKASYYDAMVNEMDLLPITYENAKIDQPLDIPVLVITAGNSFEAFSKVPGMPVEESNKVWFELQEQLKNVSSDSRQRILKNATHDLLLTAHSDLVNEVVPFVKDLKR